MTGRRSIAGPFRTSAVLAALIPLALSGCSLADVEDARLEAGTVDRETAALRATPAGPCHSAVRVVERPYVGLEPVEEDRRGHLPERFPGTDAVTPLLRVQQRLGLSPTQFAVLMRL